jgi:hypothetical protein
MSLLRAFWLRGRFAVPHMVEGAEVLWDLYEGAKSHSWGFTLVLTTPKPSGVRCQHDLQRYSGHSGK